MQAIVTRKQKWMRAMALDPRTGLDPPGGVKVRAAQGLDAASYFVTGYWIWGSQSTSAEGYFAFADVYVGTLPEIIESK